MSLSGNAVYFMEHEIGCRVTLLPCYQEPTNCSCPETD